MYVQPVQICGETIESLKCIVKASHRKKKKNVEKPCAIHFDNYPPTDDRKKAMLPNFPFHSPLNQEGTHTSLIYRGIIFEPRPAEEKKITPPSSYSLNSLPYYILGRSCRNCMFLIPLNSEMAIFPVLLFLELLFIIYSDTSVCFEDCTIFFSKSIDGQ